MTTDHIPEHGEQRLFEDGRVRFRTSAASFTIEEIGQAIHQRFEKQVAGYGNRIAVRTNDLEWTYEELNRRANRIAHSISAICGTATPLVLLFGHDTAALPAMIGGLKSGRTYVPISASNPSMRIRSIMEGARAGLIVTHARTIGKARALAGGKIRVLNVDEIDRNVSDENPQNPVSPDSFAYILYTSGSSGQPKGVLQTHRNLLHQVYSYANAIGITASDRLSLLPSFDVGAGHLDLYAALLNGASLFPFNIREEGFQRLTAWLMEERITVYHSVPTVFRYIAGHLPQDMRFPELRVINLGGEHVGLKDIELFRKYFSRDSIFVNSLACTEAGPFARYFADHDSELHGGTVPAGYPAEDMEILLLDDQGNRMSGDGTGEILIRSRYLSPGYWQNPDMTEAAFRADPDGQGTRIYHTGDFGRIRRDGMLYYLGRKDFQVKIRGNRVEIPEIETVLLAQPEIREAAVVGCDDPEGNKYLAAYLVSRTAESIPPAILRNYLSNFLPDYMMPSRFIFLKSLPTTPNGKLDRNALKAIHPEDRGQEDIFSRPEHPVEQEFVDCWKHLLKKKEIRVSDNFFELGGDSLTAIDLFCWIEKTYGKRISSSAIYKWPTIGQLAAIVAGSPESGPALCVIPVRIKGSGPPLFVIPSILGSTLSYSALLQHLDRDQIVYGIEMSENDIDKPMGAAADFYADQIRKVFPSGPYSLIGYSSGGVMALEIARRFGEMNAHVSFIGMIDTVFPSSGGNHLPESGKVSPLMFLVNLPFWLYYVLPYWAQHYRRLAKSRNARLHAREVQNRILTVRHWLERYSPESYSGRVVFYRARAQGLFTAGPNKDLKKICSALDICTVPGDHKSMMKDPHVRYLAEKINQELRSSASRLPEFCEKVKTEFMH